jgi:hypothetical protein
VSADELLPARARVPQHVVYRSFVSETVVLNLNTGKYHGLNPTGGRMLEVLDNADSVKDAAAKLSTDYGQPPDDMERDVCEFCADLIERGLIEIDASDR